LARRLITNKHRSRPFGASVQAKPADESLRQDETENEKGGNQMLEIKSNGSKWYGQEPDSIETLLDAFSKYTLDPRFENYGDFVNLNPQWLNRVNAEKYAGCASIFGNFMNGHGVFNIITDDQELIAKIAALVNQNKQTPEYKQHKKELLGIEERKKKAEKLFGEGKITLKELYQH
jgi:hypothetical protein